MRAFTGRAALFMLLLACAGASFTRAASAACADLPPSTLRLYAIEAPDVQEFHIPSELLSGASGDEIGSRHTLMLTTSDVITVFEIKHRLVPQADGSVCDAPSLVRIGFGAGHRFAYLARAIADDSCVRQKMLAHEADHAGRFNAAVDRFLDEQQSNLRQGVTALKQMPAANAALAKARWEAGLRAILAAAKEPLLDDIRAATLALDNEATAALADACGGKIRQLQENDGL